MLEAWNQSQDQLRENSEEYLAGEEYQKVVLMDQSVVRNPRGAITPHVTRDGHVALLFYNNGHTERVGYTGRLVVWLTMGRVEKEEVRWSQPEVAVWWDGVQLDGREDWNEDWAIVDGAGYHDIQELPNGGLAFVESNKLTVRYHEIEASLVDGLKCQLDQDCTVPEQIPFEDIVVNFEGKGSTRAPVLPDLRAGGGFTIACWIHLDKLQSSPKDETKRVFVNGTTVASGALDEPAAGDISKGYQIFADKDDILQLQVTDGFSSQFTFPLAGLQEWYAAGDSSPTMVAFILDGGPRIASCVINQRLYNAAPCGWRFLPKDFGEIGGSNVEVAGGGVVDRLIVFETALTTSQAIQLYRYHK